MSPNFRAVYISDEHTDAEFNYYYVSYNALKLRGLGVRDRRHEPASSFSLILLESSRHKMAELGALVSSKEQVNPFSAQVRTSMHEPFVFLAVIEIVTSRVTWASL